MGKLFVRDNAGAWQRIPVSVDVPGCQLIHSTTQSIPLGPTTVFLNFNTTNRDTNGFRNASASPTEIVIPVGFSGIYIISPEIIFAQNVTSSSSSYGTKNLVFSKNGVVYPLTTCGRNEGLSSRMNGSMVVKANEGDVFKVGASTSGSVNQSLEIGAQVSFTRLSGL